MSNQELISKINGILSEEFEVSQELIVPDAPLMQTLDLDSLDIVDVIVLVEKHFGFVMSKDDLSGMKTFSDFYDYILTKIQTP
ncbi:MAG: phosphopantetheine-binding protein [Bacteroidales bacterium]